MRALILASGVGERLYPLTKDKPKGLLEIGGKTLLERHIQNLNNCGISDIVIVVGHFADKIEQACGSDIKYIYNPFDNISNNLVSVWLAKNEIRDGFILIYVDVLYDNRILQKLLTVEEDICIGVDKKDRCLEEDMKVKVKDGFVVEINKTMNISEAYGEYIGMAKFSKNGARRLVDTLEEVIREGELSLWFASALQRLIDKGNRIQACLTENKPWIEIDFPEDLERAQTQVYLRIQHRQKSI